MNVIVPYQCARCGYTTKDKFNMRNHLYKKIKLCPALKSNTELTDDIKDFILANRIYKEPKVTKQIKFIEFPKRLGIINEKHYIYLLQPKEYVSKNENVYKIGRTVVKGVDKFSRLESYGKGANIILTCQCVDSILLEKQILLEFNSKFSRHEFGTEYFVGDCSKMAIIIYTTIIKETNENNKIKEDNIEINTAVV